MRPTLTMAALIAASPALATSCPQGQFYRVPATSDPLTADPPPDEVDEAAWLMIPLLRAVRGALGRYGVAAAR